MSDVGSVSQPFNQLEMWANAQRDGRPAEYRQGGRCSTPQSLADAKYWSAV